MDPPAEAHESNTRFKNVCAVYGYVVLGLIVTAVTVVLCFQVESLVSFVRHHFMITLILTFSGMTVIVGLFNQIPYPECKYKKLAVWTVICVITAIPLVDADLGALLKAVIYTSALVVPLSLTYFLIPFKIANSFIYPMTALHTVVLVSTMYSVVAGVSDWWFSQAVTIFCLHGGLLVYSILLVCNTQRLSFSAQYSRFDPIFSAVVMFMNIINIFSRVATFCSMEESITKC